MELCTHEKAVFFLPVNILTVRSLTFLAAQHTTVCLDNNSSGRSRWVSMVFDSNSLLNLAEWQCNLFDYCCIDNLSQ